MTTLTVPEFAEQVGMVLEQVGMVLEQVGMVLEQADIQPFHHMVEVLTL